MSGRPLSAWRLKHLSLLRNIGASPVFAVSVAIVGTLVLITLAMDLLLAPLSYDGSYNLQIAQNLATQGRYATTGPPFGDGSLSDFDPLITTGPTVLAPTGVLLLLDPTSTWLAKVVPGIYFVALLVMCALVGWRIAGRWSGLASVAAALQLNTYRDWPRSVIYGSTDVVGEYAATALLLLAGCSVLRRPGRAGILLGLAVLTKTLLALALPALLIAGCYLATGYRTRIRVCAEVLLGTLAPLLLWQSVKLASLGLRDYGLITWKSLQWLREGGSGLDGGASYSLSDHLAPLLDATQVPGFAVLLLVALAYAIRIRQAGPYEDESARGRRGLTIAVGGAGLTMLAWWLWLSDRMWVRHVVPAMICLLVVGVAHAVRAFQEHGWRPSTSGTSVGTGLLVALVATLALGGPLTAMAATTAPLSVKQQAHAAAAVDRDRLPELRFYGHPFWWHPELAFLSKRPTMPLDDGGGYLVIDPTQKVIDHDGTRLALSLCDRMIYDREGYTICWVAPRVGLADQNPYFYWVTGRG